MKNYRYSVSAVAAVVALAGAVVLAHGAPPVVGGAVGAAGNLGVGVGFGSHGIGTSGASAFSGASGFSASGASAFTNTSHGAVAAQGTGTFSTGNSFAESFGRVESIGMRQERVAQASPNRESSSRPDRSDNSSSKPDSNASVMGEARGQAVATFAAGNASGSLNTAETVHAIQAQAMESREQLLTELHSRVETSAKAMADVKKSGAKLDGTAKADFESAADDVKAKQKALEASIKAAKKADAVGWTEARAKLATDFDAYASAVARAEAASQGGTKSSEPPKN